MTVDVEDYFQVSAFEQHVAASDWPKMSCRIPRNIDKILGLFARHDVRATFFTLGWVAEHHPSVVRRIAEAGHEIASHGYRHVRATQQSRSEFESDVDRTKKLLEDVTGCEILGYRAASYSIGASNIWALDVLRETGHRYSSSIYPVQHDLYGMPEAPRFAFRTRQNGLLEIPITTISLRHRNYPCGGGGFFRLYPYIFSRWAIRRVNQRDKQPAVFYFHPWEIDPAQPRVSGLPLKTRFRHYLNLARFEQRLDRLLTDFKWDSMNVVYGMSREA